MFSSALKRGIYVSPASARTSEHISDHILADRLRVLEQHGLIQKNYLPGNPPRTEYALTPKGSELSTLLDGLCQFASHNMNL